MLCGVQLAMKFRKPFIEASSLNTASAWALTLAQTSSRSACFMAAYSSLDSRGCSGWSCSCVLPIKLDKSISHYLPFAFFFFFCLEWPGAGCWRSCCLAFSAFFSACSCLISCSCCFTNGF